MLGVAVTSFVSVSVSVGPVVTAVSTCVLDRASVEICGAGGVAVVGVAFSWTGSGRGQ